MVNRLPRTPGTLRTCFAASVIVASLSAATVAAADTLSELTPPVNTANLERLRDDAQLGASVRQLLAVWERTDTSGSHAGWWLDRAEPIENAPESITPRGLILEMADGQP